MRLIQSKNSGAFFIALASLFWAADSLFRIGVLRLTPPLMLVYFEHLILFILTAPILIFQSNKFRLLGHSGWISAFIVGVGGSATALLLFTMSFEYINPSVSILLQKLHPVFAISLAALFLKEKITVSLLIWGGIALLIGLLMGGIEIFGSREIRPPTGEFLNERAVLGILLSISAAFIWGASTAASRHLALKTGHLFSIAIRFFLGFITLFSVIAYKDGVYAMKWELHHLLSEGGAWYLIYLTLVSGFLAMFFYYYGIKSTRAQVATFLETLWPLFAAFFNWVAFGISMSFYQILLALLLIWTVHHLQAKLRET